MRSARTRPINASEEYSRYTTFLFFLSGMRDSQDVCICIKIGTKIEEFYVNINILFFEYILDTVENHISRCLKVTFSKMRIGGMLHVAHEHIHLAPRIIECFHFFEKIEENKYNCIRNWRMEIQFANYLSSEFKTNNQILWDQGRIFKVVEGDKMALKRCRDEIIDVKQDDEVSTWTWMIDIVNGVTGYAKQKINLKDLTCDIELFTFDECSSWSIERIQELYIELGHAIGFLKTSFNVKFKKSDSNVFENIMHSLLHLSTRTVISKLYNTLKNMERGYSSLVDMSISISDDTFLMFLKSVYAYSRDCSPGIHGFDPKKMRCGSGVILSMGVEKDIVIGIFDRSWKINESEAIFWTCRVHSSMHLNESRYDLDAIRLQDLDWNCLHQQIYMKKCIIPNHQVFDISSIESFIKILNRRKNFITGEINIALPISTSKLNEITVAMDDYNYSIMNEIDTVVCLPLRHQIDWVNMMVPCVCLHDKKNEQICITKIGRIDMHIGMSDSFTSEGTGSFLSCVSELIQPFCQDVYSFNDMIKNHVFSKRRSELLTSLKSIQDTCGRWDENLNSECRSGTLGKISNFLGLNGALLKVVLPYLPNILYPDPGLRLSNNFIEHVITERRPGPALNILSDDWSVHIEFGEVLTIRSVIDKEKLSMDTIKIDVENYVSVGIWKVACRFVLSNMEGHAVYDYNHLSLDSVRIVMTSFREGVILSYFPMYNTD